MKFLHILVAAMCLVLMPLQAFAQEEFPYPQEDMPVPDAGTDIFKGTLLYPPQASLEEKAVILASKTDAMNMVCGKDTQLAISYVRRFAEQGVDVKEVKRLENVGITALEERVKMIVDDQTSCKDSNFLLERFRVMRELRAVSYQLKGIDPSSIPSAGDFSEIEKLLPKNGVAEEGVPR